MRLCSRATENWCLIAIGIATLFNHPTRGRSGSPMHAALFPVVPPALPLPSASKLVQMLFSSCSGARSTPSRLHLYTCHRRNGLPARSFVAAITVVRPSIATSSWQLQEPKPALRLASWGGRSRCGWSRLDSVDDLTISDFQGGTFLQV